MTFIDKKTSDKIIKNLKEKTGYNWTGDGNMFYCNPIINHNNRFETEEMFLQLLESKGISKPLKLNSELLAKEFVNNNPYRDIVYDRTEIIAEFTAASMVNSILKNPSPKHSETEPKPISFFKAITSGWQNKDKTDPEPSNDNKGPKF